MFLNTAKLKPGAPLQIFRQGREGLVLKAVRHLAAHVAVGQRLTGRDKVGLDSLVIAPYDFFQRAAPGPVQAFDGQVQKRDHNAPRALADLRKLPAVKKHMFDRQAGGGQKCQPQVGTDGRCHDQRQFGYALRLQKGFNLPHLVLLAAVGLPGTVDGRGRQNAEIAVLQAFGNRLTAGPGHAHGGEKQNGGFGLIAHCGKKHRFSTFPLLCRFFQQNNFIGKALLQLAAETAEPDVNEPETPDAEAPATTEKPAADESTKPETGKEDASVEGNGDGNGQVPPGQTEDVDGNIVNPGGNMAPGLNRGEHIDKPDNPNKPDKPENPGTEDKDDKKANKANSGTHIYTYDELNRMVSSNIAKVVTNYTYDTLGNLVLETSKNKSVDYEYNELNQLVRKTTSNNEVFTYTYDARGNRIAETGKNASQSFVYDATNRLVEGTNWKGDKSAYTYNGLGLRVNNLVTTHTGKTYDRDYVIDYTSPENDDLYVYAMGNGQLEYEQRHVYAGSERLEQITEKGNGSWERTLYVHEDVMGNTRYYTKATGQTFAELQYDAWGQPVSPNKLLNNDHGNYVFATFTGHIYDPVLDIYFAEARFYDSTNRTWMAMDPIKDGLNWYQYAYSNSITYWDPDGENPIIGAIVGALIGGGATVVEGMLINGLSFGEILVNVVSNAAVGAAAGALIGSGIGAAEGFALASGAVAGGLTSAMTGGPVTNGMAGGLITGMVGAGGTLIELFVGGVYGSFYTDLSDFYLDRAQGEQGDHNFGWNALLSGLGSLVPFGKLYYQDVGSILAGGATDLFGNVLGMSDAVIRTILGSLLDAAQGVLADVVAGLFQQFPTCQ